ncbi:MAG: ATP-dependent protease ATPase subunit HslU [Capsulimonadaceae bacterium]
MKDLTPREIVAELDKYIVGQHAAKRAVAIALRNRYRRRLLGDDLRDEVIPKNILMIGPTGVGKTEIARRLAVLARAPFVKVEATKFTEVGYVGRDVDSMVRDLVQASVRMVEREKTEEVRDRAAERAVERIVDILQPRRPEAASPKQPQSPPTPPSGPRIPAEVMQALGQLLGNAGPGVHIHAINADVPDGKERPQDHPREPAPEPDDHDEEQTRRRTEQEKRVREHLRQQVRSGVKDAEEIEIEVEESSSMPFLHVMGPQGSMEDGSDVQSMFGAMLPRRHRQRRMTIGEAREYYTDEEAREMIDHDQVTRDAIARAEQSGIIFIDEMDKVAGRTGPAGGSGPDVSREGVQRDLLPIIEGSTVQTKQGPVKTDFVLFIAAGAFHVSKPSDLIPELQGRLPIRVELDSLTDADFRRILTEPRNALINQYKALLATEGITLEFTDDAVAEIARIAAEVNSQMENIGARRLHTVMERLLDEISFNAPEDIAANVTIDAAYVINKLADIVKNEDLSRYIL